MAELFDDHVPLMKPWLGDEEVAAAGEAILSGWVSLGPRVHEFERAVADYVGARHAVATNACTTALHLSLQLSGIGPGDRVLCPTFTCMATANAIHLAGATPVFVDIDPRTYNVDPAAAADLITPDIGGILVVHQIGLPAEMDSFRELAKRHDLAIVEDGACSLGATYRGRQVGGLGAPTCFSFHPRKMITTGEGGMITTNDERLADKARVLRSTGASISDLERHKAKGALVQAYTDVGFNYRMTDIQAAIGLVQMGKISRMVAERAAQARRYDEALRQIEDVAPPYVPPHMTHSYSSYLIRFGGRYIDSRDRILQKMAACGVSCRIGIQPLHWEPVYAARYAGVRFPASEAAAKTTMFLPIFPGLASAQQDRVIDVLKQALASER